VRRFVDTNVLVYANDAADPDKQRIARETLLSHASELVLSAQVLSELYVALVRPSGLGMAPADARMIVDDLRRFPILPIDDEMVLDAIDLSIRERTSYWDGLILTTAQAGGCEVVLSEDLSHGTTVGGVRVENPFLTLA
jgi:predicted nucleic acid-binding protein